MIVIVIVILNPFGSFHPTQFAEMLGIFSCLVSFLFFFFFWWEERKSSFSRILVLSRSFVGIKLESGQTVSDIASTLKHPSGA